SASEPSRDGDAPHPGPLPKGEGGREDGLQIWDLSSSSSPERPPEHPDPRADARAAPERPEERDRDEGGERLADADGDRDGLGATGLISRVELDVDQDQDAQDAPEQGVGDAEAPGAH